MGTIAIDVQTSANTAPISETRNQIQLTAEEAREFGRVLAENNNNLEIATKKFVALREAAAGASQALKTTTAGAAAGGPQLGPFPSGAVQGPWPVGPAQLGPALATVPDIVNRANQQIDAMNPRLRTAASAMSRLAFESINLGGSVQGAVRSAGMLTYSLASMSSSAAVAASAAGIGAVAITVAAGIGLWEEYHDKLDKARQMMDSLNAASVSLTAGLQGNQLGVKELHLADEFNKQRQQIEKEFGPGWFNKLVTGLFAATGNLSGAVSNAMQGQLTAATLTGRLGENLVQANAAAAIEDARRKALANAAGFAAGPDPIADYKAKLHLIDVERDQAIKKGEMSEAAADARAAGQKERLAREDADRTLSLFQAVAEARAKLEKNVFDQRTVAENIRYANEQRQIERNGVDQKSQLAEALRLHQLITAEIAREGKLVAEAARIQAGEGDLNPVTRIKAEIAAIEARRVAAVKAGASEADAAKIAENEKRNLYAQTLDAAVRSSDSLGKVLKRAALEPVVSFLEGLAIQEGIKAIAHYADFDLVGGALHTAAAAAAAGGAREVAQLGGLTSGGGGGRGGGGGGGGQFVPNAQQQGGNQTVLIQIGDVSNQALVNTLRYEIDRSGMLGKPVVAPMGRPS